MLFAAGIGLALAGKLAELERHRLLLALAHDAELDRAAGRHSGNGPRQLTRVLHLLAVDRGDDVARHDAGLGCGASDLRLIDDRAFGLLHAEAVRNIGRYGLDANAHPAADHVALLHKLGNDRLGGVRRDIEADADRAARGRIDRGIDPDHIAVDI